MNTLFHYRTIYVFISSLMIMCSLCKTLQADIELIEHTRVIQWPPIRSVSSYLLPENHPLQHYLINLFPDSKMFRSAENFRQAGFNVKLGHRELMVGAHPSIPNYLVKKFRDTQPRERQLENYIKRIKGAKILRDYIEKHHFKHLVVPQKWLYLLPSSFSNHKSYVLIVDNMDICDKEENLQLYYNMDKEVLTELCTILHAVGGCDAFPRNQPFTRSGKIAFVDTEHVGQMKGHFIKHVVPTLNEELQAYALALWKHLEHHEKGHIHKP